MAATATLPAADASAAPRVRLRPHLTFAQILSMNFGFFGIQYSFGLQQGNMSPIYRYLAPTRRSCRCSGSPGR